MIAISSTVDINGISVTISVRLTSESVKRQVGDPQFVFSAEEFSERLAPPVSLEVQNLLLQAHSSISQSLLVASIKLLKEEAAA